VRHQICVFSKAACPRGDGHVPIQQRQYIFKVTVRIPRACGYQRIVITAHIEPIPVRHFPVRSVCHLVQQASDIVWMAVCGGRKSDLDGVAFHDVIVNVAVLFAERWVRNRNVFGIAGKVPLWRFDAHVNSIAMCERATNGNYWIPRFCSQRYLIPVFFDRRAIIRILCASDERGRQQDGQGKGKATHAS
jgi:hypothetical protein